MHPMFEIDLLERSTAQRAGGMRRGGGRGGACNRAFAGVANAHYQPRQGGGRRCCGASFPSPLAMLCLTMVVFFFVSIRLT